MSIREFLIDDHRHCDDFFAAAEQAVERGDAAAAAAAFAQFSAALLRHFQAEEQTLFPAFEARTGMTMGPTRVMRMEHEQMRGLLEVAAEALAAGDVEEFLGQGESLLIMMQQHNMKEENVLYPMCDQQLAGDPSVLDRLHAELGAA